MGQLVELISCRHYKNNILQIMNKTVKYLIKTRLPAKLNLSILSLFKAIVYNNSFQQP